MIYDLRNVKVLVDELFPTEHEMRNSHMRDAEGEFISRISVNDGEWHFLAVSWNQDDGRIALYVDGDLLASSDERRAFIGKGKTIPSEGTFQIGASLIGVV